ncbi:MAG: glycosyltransferase family 4 protein [Actinomycetota bacterium]|nr:glycosyltransferase family 4 protein [Actinomycetota bacterium]
MAVALLTNNLVPYRVPLYERLAAEYGVEVLCWGGGRYLAPWFEDLDEQLAAARFPARRLGGAREALSVGRDYETVISAYAGGAILPAAYVGARRRNRGFVLWASVWAQPRSFSNDLALPMTRWIYRHADAVVAYGEHARRFAAGIRGRDTDVFVAPQAVEAELFARPVSTPEIQAFRAEHGIPDGQLVLYVGRLVAEKGLGVLADAWPEVRGEATLVVIGDGPLQTRLSALPRTVLLPALPRERLPVAYRAASLTVLPSVPTRRFREPWGLVVNEAMHQGRPVVVTSAVGAAAGGMVVDEQTGLVISPGDSAALAAAIQRLLSDPALGARLGEAGRAAVAGYTYEAMAAAFGRGLALARRH